jgi:phosphatidate cytidylyltransferase
VQRTLAGLLPAALAAALPPAALAGIDWLLGAVVLLIVALGSVFAWTGNPRAGLEDWLWGVALGLYVGVLASHAALLRDAPDGRDWLFFSVLVVWITDTGAYAVGRAIGRHKLAPVDSPGKTIEGAIGSFVTGFVAVLALSELFGLDVGLADQVALGFLLPPIILVGDLAESAIKRALDVKDSGFLVPGHGGVLDRLDSLLFAIPVVYYYLELVVQ